MLTATPQDNLSLLCFTRVLLCRHSTPPPATQRAVVLGCEGDSCWRRSYHSYGRCSNPGGAADPEHSGHRAVAEGCCVRVACRRSPMWESREKCCASVGFEPTSPSNPGWYANRYTTRQLIFTLLYPRVIVPPHFFIALSISSLRILILMDKPL
ncbi:hypothetical protein Zmor_017840 [Zophobas morio]|uniref:Uncharacterized protein n=1 Tax=Zophobas morio TaxID=2755281 RepID=A0AA38MD02_9CUCU|nr:hypothetical protein Zmor_017840 [Zophobas morio]